MKEQDAFSDFHPAVSFTFFVLAILFCMFFRHPAFTLATLLLSFLYAVTIQGLRAVKFTLAMLPVLLLISLINPLFNSLGQTVLFTYFGGRVYSLEALAYGACTGCMFVSMFIWFSSYNRVMTSDKFTYLFGGMAPSITLTLTMALRLVPTYLNKLSQFSHCRASMGKSIQVGTTAEKASHGADLLSQLTSWAFESAVQTADSMKSRGYGVGKRSSFSIYHFSNRDAACLVFMGIMAALSIAGAVAGVQDIVYYPTIDMPAVSPLFVVSLCAYCVLLALPTLINAREIVLWRSSLSRM